MENERQNEFPESRRARREILEQALKSLCEKRDLAKKLRESNLRAAKEANDPEEVSSVQKRYLKEVTRLDIIIRRVEARIRDLQAAKNLEKKPILLVDDEKNIRLTLSKSLEPLGLPVHTAVNGEEALQKLQEGEFGLLLLDLKMQGMDGMEVLQRVRKTWPMLPVIIITAHGTIESAVDAMKLGAADFIQKPFSPQEIRNLVSQVMGRQGSG